MCSFETQRAKTKVKAPFIDEISGLAIIKILDASTHSTILIKNSHVIQRQI